MVSGQVVASVRQSLRDALAKKIQEPFQESICAVFSKHAHPMNKCDASCCMMHPVFIYFRYFVFNTATDRESGIELVRRFTQRLPRKRPLHTSFLTMLDHS